MKKAKRWLLISTVLLVFVAHAIAAGPFKKVALATTTKATTTTNSTATTEASSTEAPSTEAPEETKSDGKYSKLNPQLTGIPQIDWYWDPNLPHELHGYNLSSYPFYSTVPLEEDIHFKCDGLHDGFYASIEHKCQVYHHCVYGIRHDFLCANFTAFDQRTFICHFVSDVDCEGSPKYWSRNDALYMATTTTSTTTTTIEPPLTRRRQQGRPRRPINRRPADDYYYDDEEYGDDYYEERLNRRHKHRRRHRNEDEYDEKRSFDDDDKPRRPSSRDRFRDEDETDDEYDSGDRRKYDRPSSRNKSNDRRKSTGRKPGPGRSGAADERRSFSDDRPLNGRKDKPLPVDDVDEPIDTQPRRPTGRRRINEKRASSTAADLDDLDDYEKPNSRAPDQEEAADGDTPPKVKTTPKPLEEFVTPKAAPASVYARPRAPPRIARPVPVNEKKKFKYPVQRTATTASPDAVHADDDYYEEEEYDDVRGQRGPARRRIIDDKFEEDDLPAAKRRNHNDAPAAKKSVRTTIRKPVIDKKPNAADDEDYDSTGNASNERIDSRGSARKRPYSSRPRASGRGGATVAEEVDFVDDDYDDHPVRPAHRLRPKVSARKGAKKPRLPIIEEEEELYEDRASTRSRTAANPNRRKNVPSARLRQSTPTAAALAAHDVDSETIAEDESATASAPGKSSSTSSSGRTASVRVVKRPFLPSRGGSPYLPRGLQPVGIALKPLSGSTHTTDSTPIDMGSTISGVRLLEHGAPILRDSGFNVEREATQGPRTTLPPRSAIPVSQVRQEPQPKITLDELYENDYDVTLNDALNPTLKPLSPLHQIHPPPPQPPLLPHNHNYANEFASAPATNTFVNNNQSPAIYHNNNNNNNYQQQHQNAYQSVPPLPQSHQPSQSQSLSQSIQSHQQQQPQSQQQQHAINNYNSDDDSYFSSTDIRRRAIVPAPILPQSSRTDYRGVGMRIAQHFYDDLEY